MAICTIAAGVWGAWEAATTWEGGVVPTSVDDVVARSDGTSMSVSTSLVQSATCRTLDLRNYTKTLDFMSKAIGILGGFFMGMNATISGNQLNLGSGSDPTEFIIDAPPIIFGQTISIASGHFVLAQAPNSITLPIGSTAVLRLNGFVPTTWFLRGGTIDASDTTCSWTTQLASATGTTFIGNSNAYHNINGVIGLVAGSYLGNTTLNASLTGVTLNSYQFNSLTYIPTTTGYINLAGDLTVTSLLTLKGNATAYANRLILQSDTICTQRTITAGSVDMAYIDVCDVAANNWDLSAIPGNSGNRCGNSGITFTPSATQTLKGAELTNAANWTTRVPLPQDDVILTNSSFSGTITAGVSAIACRNIDCSGFTGSFPMGGLSLNIYGNFSKGNCTCAAINHFFKGRGTPQTLTSNGWTNVFPMSINKGSTVRLVDNLTIGAYMSSGTLLLNGFTATMTSATLNTGSLLDIRNSTLNCNMMGNTILGTLLADGSTVNLTAYTTACTFTDPLHTLNIIIGSYSRSLTFNNCSIENLQIGQCNTGGRVLTMTGAVSVYKTFKLSTSLTVFSLSGLGPIINKSGGPFLTTYTLPSSSASFACAWYGPPMYLLRTSISKFIAAYTNQRVLKYGPRNERRESYRRMRGNPCQR